MKDLILDIWLAVLIANLFMVVIRVFSTRPTSIRFSLWFRLFVMHIPSAILILVLTDYPIDWSYDGSPRFFIINGLILWAIVYFPFAFRVEYSNERFMWCFGLGFHKIQREELIRVYLYKRKNKISKVGFVLVNDKTTKMRVDHPYFAELATEFARQIGVPVTEINAAA